MPFFCPILPHTPTDRAHRNDPAGSGPYYVQERVVNQRIVLKRNPYYRGDRPANVDQVALDVRNLRGLPGRRRAEPDRLLLPGYRASAPTPGREVRHQPARRAVLRQSLTSGLPSSRSTTTDPRSTAPARSRSRRRSTTQSTDRRWPASSATSAPSAPTSCSRPRSPAPRASTRSKAPTPPPRGNGSHGRRSNRARSSSTRTTAPQGVAIAQTLVYDLKQIGIDVQVKYFFLNALAARVATRGEPFDLALNGWIPDYADRPASSSHCSTGQRTAASTWTTRAWTGASRRRTA